MARRRLDVPSLIANEDFKWDETTGHLYLYKTLLLESMHRSFSGWQAALYVEGEYEKVERPQVLTGPEGIMELRTMRVPIGIRFFGGNGLTLRLATTYVDQEGTFSADVDFGVVSKKDDAWITEFRRNIACPGDWEALFSVSITLLTPSLICWRLIRSIRGSQPSA